MVDAALQRVQFFGFARNPQTTGLRCTDFHLLDDRASRDSIEVLKSVIVKISGLWIADEGLRRLSILNPRLKRETWDTLIQTWATRQLPD